MESDLDKDGGIDIENIPQEVLDLLENIKKKMEEYRSKYLSHSLEPFEVEAELSQPVVVDVFSVHLDGILTTAVLRDAGFSVEMMNHLSMAESIPLVPIPLPLYWEGSFWSGSAIWCPDGATGITYWRKRWDDKYVKWARRKRKIHTGSGGFRSYNMPLTTLSAPTVKFYAYGNPSETLRLLREHISHIGKKGSQGYGMVKKWRVRPTEEILCYLRKDPDGVIFSMRSLPLWFLSNKDLITKTIATVGISPPYWHPRNMVNGVLPYTRLYERVG